MGEDLMALGYTVTHTDAPPLSSVAPDGGIPLRRRHRPLPAPSPARTLASVDELYQALLRIPSSDGAMATLPGAGRQSYRGLYPFEADDGALFFGRARHPHLAGAPAGRR